MARLLTANVVCDHLARWRRALSCDNLGPVRRLILVGIALAGTLASAAWITQPAPPPAPRSLPGWPLYDRFCLPCHGEAGDGLGPAAPFTTGRPRDLTLGDYAWRTTPLGTPPTDDDLRLTILRGAPGTSMHGFALSRAQLDQLVDVVRAFAPAARPPGTTGDRVVVLAAPPATSDVARGAQLWTDKGCAACHGATGAGDGAAAKSLAQPPYDLARSPLRRPRPDAPTDWPATAPWSDAHATRHAAALAIATGRTAMPGYKGTLPDADIWALADHVIALSAGAHSDRSVLDARAIDLDRTARIAAGTWPASGTDAIVFGGAIPAQGAPPSTLAPAQASLSAQQCARCHVKQYREWETSLHRGATSPGLAAQMMGMKPAEAASCLRCHAPLPEQRANPRLHAQGLTCAVCHLRGWTRHGPPNLAPSLLPLPGYPLATLAVYERSDFCLPCHQLPPRSAVEGRPLLDTYREWLEGPYMPRGIQCQHCHMPNREHTFLGVHDAHTFRQGIALTGRAHRRDGAVTVVAELANVGAGHYLPTTPTPAAWLVIELVDAAGKVIDGATAGHRIGRDIYFDDRWHERADTRIPPGEKIAIARAWRGGRTPAAAAARLSVRVHPDDYYERLYEQRLAGKLAPARRKLYEQALAKAKAARYVATQQDLAIAPSPPPDDAH